MAVGMENVPVIVPPGVIRPIVFEEYPVNQRLPSGPVTMS